MFDPKQAQNLALLQMGHATAGAHPAVHQMVLAFLSLWSKAVVL